MTERFTKAQAEAMFHDMGPEAARAYFAQHPEMAPGTEKEYPTVQQDPVDEAETDAEDETSGSGLSVDRLNADTLNYQKRMQDLRMKQFETARDVLKERQAGPSMSERLAQLSAAFFRPKWTPGWAGTMSNVMPLLAKQSEATRTARDTKADTMRELQDKYDTGTLTGEGDILDYRLKLAKLRDDQRKAAQPKVQINNATGEVMEVPNIAGVAKPHSDAEVALLPPGTWYKLWTGPKAGKLVRKGSE